jgi:transcription termination factor NusB
MTIDPNFIFSLIAAVLSLGALAAGYGSLRAKVNENAAENHRQAEEIKECATKIELLAVEKRMEEDRVRNNEQHKEFYASRQIQGERIGAIETAIEFFSKTFTEIKDNLEKIDRKIDQMNTGRPS